MPQQRIEFEGTIHEFPSDFTDADIAAALSGGTVAPMPSHTPAPGSAGTSAALAVANMARQGLERAGLEIATSPTTGRLVRAATPTAAKAIGGTVGYAAGHMPGAAAGYVAGEAASTPAVKAAVEATVRGGGGMLARLAASPIARAVTGLPGLLAAMPFTEGGDRPVGETPTTTADRQSDFAHNFKDQINREAGYEVIKGNTSAEIIDSIAAYRGGRR